MCNKRLKADGIETTVYRKSTHTGVFLNFCATVPRKWKFGLIYCLLHRAYDICSSQDLFNGEIKKLRTMFSLNGYTTTFFNQVLTKYQDTKEQGPRSPSEPKRGVFFRVPYIGSASVIFQKEMSKLINDKFGQPLRTVYTTCKVGDFFSLKAQSPFLLASNVVYRFTCSLDVNTSYIGKTERHLIARVKEHLDLQGKKQSAVKDHIKDCAACQANTSIDNFTILKHCKNYRDVNVHETFLIRHHKPSLNVQLFNNGGCLLKIY